MPAPDTIRLQWRKSNRSSGNGACVEVADLAHGIAVRDSKNTNGPTLTFSLTAWRAFHHQTRTGLHDL